MATEVALTKEEKAADKIAEEAEKRSLEFSDDRVQAFRAVVQAARTLDEKVDSRLITPKEAMQRLQALAGTPVELKKPVEEPEIPKTAFEKALEKAVKVEA